MIKKLLLIIATVPGILGILITLVAMRLTGGFDTNSIDVLAKYLDEFNGGNGSLNLMESDAGFLYALHKISEYAHWIITACVIWIVSILYILESQRRGKRGKQKEEI